MVLRVWFYLRAYVVLVGAELNSEFEHQTERDTTRSAPQLPGRRGGYVADTVGQHA